MEALLSNRVAVVGISAHQFRTDNCTSDPASCTFLLRPSCFRGFNSLRKGEFRRLSRSLGGVLSDEDRRICRPLAKGRSGLTCKASSEGIDLHLSNPYEDDSDDEAGAVGGISVAKVIQALGEFASANFLIVALSCSVIFGLAWPGPGRAAQQMGLAKWCTSAIFFSSGLNLRNGDAEQGVAAWATGVFGLVSILLITPLAAIPILSLQSSPRELVVGLAIFACVPTTLSSAVCLTQIAGANTTLAIGMTVLSNLISIVTMPFMLSTLVGGGIGVSIAPGQLLQSLIHTLLVPLVLGKIIRETFSGVAKLVDGNRRKVSMLTGVIQSLVPWMQLSTSRAMLLRIEPSNLLVVAAAGLAVHITYLVSNLIMMKFVPSPCIRDDYNARAVLLVTSQKSIVVSLAVIDRLGGAFGEAGLLVLPCIAGQFSQVITDSILVNIWLRSDAREKELLQLEEAH
ncbi:unnamed protein product [Calypogeia fissa]